MRSVNIAELKNKLSAYVTFAKAGETVVIRDRNRPVAKLVPFVAESASEREANLVARGIIRLPVKETNWDVFLDMPMAQLSEGSEGMTLTQALLDEREEGYYRLSVRTFASRTRRHIAASMWFVSEYSFESELKLQGLGP